MSQYNKYEQSFGGREEYFPCKLQKDRTSDCVIRAISHAIPDKTYLQIMTELFELGLSMGELPSEAKCYSAYLEQNGFTKHSPIKNLKNKKYEVRYFPAISDLNYIIKTTGHLTAIVKGVHLDSWNCGEWCANTYYVKF